MICFGGFFGDRAHKSLIFIHPQSPFIVFNQRNEKGAYAVYIAKYVLYMYIRVLYVDGDQPADHICDVGRSHVVNVPTVALALD